MPRALILVCGMLLSMSSVALGREWPDANRVLLHSARLWEARQRGDLAQLALRKLVAARPDSPQALVELGELDLRIRDYQDAAWVAEQLHQRFAGSPAERNFALEYRIATRERVQLASIHRLIELHRTTEARSALDRLFAGGVPAGALGIEYYELLADTPRGWTRASAGLSHLAAEHPDDPRYQLALARHWLQHPANVAAARTILHDIAARDDVDHAQVQALLAGSRRELDRQRQADADRPLPMFMPSAPQWNAQTRDAHLANAFATRAGAEATDGNLDAAIGDLETSVMLAPRDPWTRFRLANLHSVRRDFAAGRAVMDDGAQLAPADPEMRYAQALYLASLEDYVAALAAVDSIASDRRTANVEDLRDRIRVALARGTARRVAQAGDIEGARAALRAVESIADRSFERAVDLAYAWVEIGDAEHGIALLEPYYHATGTTDPHVLLTWAQVLDSALDIDRLQAALSRVTAAGAAGRSSAERSEVARLQRSLDLRVIHALEHAGRFEAAARRLDALLAEDPQDGALRAARADLYLASGEPRRARDLYAALAAEHPEDLATRLAYLRALTESGDIDLARVQLAAIRDKIPAADDELQLDFARRQLALADGRGALTTLRPLLTRSPPRSDVLLLAGQAARAVRDFGAARDYFARAEAAADPVAAATARLGREQIDARLDAAMTAGLVIRHQPGEPGESQLDVVTAPASWVVPLDYERRLTARADAVTLSGGRAGSNALLGTIEAAGAARQRYANDEQSGMSLAGGFRTDSLTADLGTTPLGFLLTNVVGGVDWIPRWNATDITLGVARRAVTNSELSFAGLKDPVTGTAWGGVVQTGPHAGIALYRERVGISCSLEYDELTGTRVADNQFLGARIVTDWKFISRVGMAADAGVSIDYWNYKRNLSNYTLGNGGYYSPQSYVSLAVPVELNGSTRGWNYRLRVSPSYTLRDLQTSAFYPTDDALQTAAAHSALPAGYEHPYFPSDRSNSIGIYALAATEREMSRGLVVGAMLEINRTDYYHPTTVAVYVRHSFGQATTHATAPVQPIRPYNP